MKNTFAQQESICEDSFRNSGQCWHLYTPEDYPVFLTGPDDFMAAMTLLAICAMNFPSIRILTFQWMNNHLHIALAGPEEDIAAMFGMLKRYLGNYMKACERKGILDSWDFKLRQTDSLGDIRNVIAYDNRNGFLVKDEYSPYDYPWGANKCFFNKDYAARFSSTGERLGVTQIRELFHTRELDGFKGLKMLDGVVCPLVYCDIDSAMRLFRNASHYFYCISRNVENMKSVAREIGESIYYNDDELFAIVCNISRGQYDVSRPSFLPAAAKVEVARKLRFEYNAKNKQVARILKIDEAVLASIIP